MCRHNGSCHKGKGKDLCLTSTLTGQSQYGAILVGGTIMMKVQVLFLGRFLAYAHDATSYRFPSVGGDGYGTGGRPEVGYVGGQHLLDSFPKFGHEMYIRHSI
jgi:hypothetical protein